MSVFDFVVVTYRITKASKFLLSQMIRTIIKHYVAQYCILY